MSFFKKRRTLAPTTKEKYNRHIPPHDIEKPIMMYRNLPNKRVEYYSEETGRFEDDGQRKNNYHELYKDGLRKVSHYLVNDMVGVAPNEENTIENCFKNFVIGATEIKRRTKGKIDFFQYGLAKPTLDKAFMSYNLGKLDKLYEMETVEKWNREDEVNNRNYDERELIESCSGALIYLERHMKLKVFKYDYNSKYNASLCDENLFIPVKRGILMKEVEEKDFIEMVMSGKYVLISRDVVIRFYNESRELYSPITINKLENPKVKGHYTEHELKLAIQMGALFINPDFEVVVYPKETHCIKASEWYGWCCKDLYEIKKRPESWQAKVLTKKCLTRIWGQHCERKKNWPVKFDKRIMEVNGERVLNLKLSEAINATFTRNEQDEVIAIHKPREQYLGWIPRIKPFILTFTRVQMMKQCNIFHMEDFKIIRIHTDSFWLNKRIENFVNMKGNAQYIGRLGYEGDQEVDTEIIRSRQNRPG